MDLSHEYDSIRMYDKKGKFRRHNHYNPFPIEAVQQTFDHHGKNTSMLPLGLYYPQHWPALYIGKDKQTYPCSVCKVHLDDIEPYYTIEVFEGPFKGERQTVPERLSSWVDTLPYEEIQQTFMKYTKQEKQAASNKNL